MSVWFGVIIRADNDRIHIGASSNVQDGSVLDADPGFPMRLGRDVTIGHKVMLHGCTVGDRALVGIKSVVMNGAKIGAASLIGAGSLIPEGRVQERAARGVVRPFRWLSRVTGVPSGSRRPDGWSLH